MSRKWKGLVSLVCLALVLMLAPAALAAVEATAPEESRISFQAPDGLNYNASYNASKQTVTITVNAARTDWTKLENYSSTTCALPVEVVLQKPANAVTARWAQFYDSMTTIDYTDEMILDRLTAANPDPLDSIQPVAVSADAMKGFFAVASYFHDAEMHYVEPETAVEKDQYTLACAWLDASGNVVGFEKLYATIAWDSSNLVTLSNHSKTAFVGIPANRINVRVADGIEFTQNWQYDETTGIFSAVINTARTNWALAAANSTFIAIDITPLAEAESMSAFGTSGSSMDQIYAYAASKKPSLLNMPGGSNRPPFNWPYYSVDIGYYDENVQMFFPEETTLLDNASYVMQWGDADCNSLGKPYEIIRFHITFTSDEPTPVEIDKVPKANIVADYKNSGYEKTVKDGSVSYVNEKTPVAAADYVTAIMTPEGGADWKAYINGRKQDMVAAAETGLARPALMITRSCGANDEITRKAQTIVWKDSNNAIKRIESLVIEVAHGAPKLWPEYIDWLEPFDPASVRVETLGGIDGTAATYDTATAVVQQSVDSEKVLKAAQTKNLMDAKATTTVTITPPANAAFYAPPVAMMGSDIAYGKEVANMRENIWANETAPQMEALQPGQTLTYDSVQNFFAKKELTLADQSKVAYYTSSDMLTGEYAANVVVYRWYDEDRNLIGGNYIVYKYDTVSLITTTDVLGSTDELDESDDNKNGKKKPLIIVDGKGQGLGQGKLALRAERSPSSAGTHHYELCLVNDSNAKVEFSGSGVVYVPYPDGYDETNCANLEITVGHYNSDSSRIVEVFSTAAEDEALKITPTKHGLRFTVTSLSPFVVSWEENIPIEIDSLVASTQMSWGNDVIPGLEATPAFQNGKYQFTIDSANTDWATAAAYYGGSQFMQIKEQIAPPHEAVKYFVATQFDKPLSELTDQQIEEGLNNELSTLEAGPQDLYNQSYNGHVRLWMNYATYLEARKSVAPIEKTYAVAVRWYDEDKNMLATQKMDVVIDFTDPSVQAANPAVVPQNRIILAQHADLVTAAYANGEVNYTVKPQTYPRLTTKVLAPSTAAVKCVVNGLDTTLQVPDASSFSNGTLELTLHAASRQLALLWYDSNDQVLLCESLPINVVEKDADPWPSYVEGWEPAKITNVVVNGAQGVLDEPVLKADISDSEIRYQYRNDYANKANLHEAKAVYTIQVPESAKSKAVRVSVMQEGHERIHRYQVSSAAMNWKNWCKDEGVFYTLSNGTFNLTDDLFRKAYSDEDVTIFQPILDNENDFGWVFGLFWMDENNNILATSWMTIQSDDFLSEGKTKPVKREADITAPVENATFVDPAGKDWVLVSQYHPQYGEKAYHVELHTVDSDGVVCQPGEDTVFFLPYPDGHAYNGPYTYKLKHYAADYRTFKWVEVKATEKGLRCVLDSLSPFVVSWEETVPDPEIQEAPKAFALTSVPAALQSKYATPTDLKLAMHSLLLNANDKIVGNVAHFDIRPMYSEDGGVTWKTMDEKDWPADKPAEVFLKYEDIKADAGLGKDTHDFHVVHMFTKAGANHAVGDKEYPAVTKEATGIRFTLKGMSPVSIGWVVKQMANDPVNPPAPNDPTNPEVPTVTPDVPKTGDSTPLMALFALMLASLAGCVVIGKRRMSQR